MNFPYICFFSFFLFVRHMSCCKSLSAFILHILMLVTNSKTMKPQTIQVEDKNQELCMQTLDCYKNMSSCDCMWCHSSLVTRLSPPAFLSPHTWHLNGPKRQKKASYIIKPQGGLDHDVMWTQFQSLYMAMCPCTRAAIDSKWHKQLGHTSSLQLWHMIPTEQ